MHKALVVADGPAPVAARKQPHDTLDWITDPAKKELAVAVNQCACSLLYDAAGLVIIIHDGTSPTVPRAIDVEGFLILQKRLASMPNTTRLAAGSSRTCFQLVVIDYEPDPTIPILFSATLPFVLHNDDVQHVWRSKRTQSEFLARYVLDHLQHLPAADFLDDDVQEIQESKKVEYQLSSLYSSTGYSEQALVSSSLPCSISISRDNQFVPACSSIHSEFHAKNSVIADQEAEEKDETKMAPCDESDYDVRLFL